MKAVTLVLCLIFTILFSFTEYSHAISKSSDTSLATLSKETIKLETDTQKLVDKIYASLEKTALQASKEKTNTLLIEQITNLAAFAATHDSSNYIGEVVMPLWKSKKTEFETAIKKLSLPKAERLREAIKITEQVSKEGNG